MLHVEFRRFRAVGEAANAEALRSGHLLSEGAPLYFLLHLHSEVLLLELQLALDEVLEDVAHLLHELVEGGLVLELTLALGVI